MSEPGSNIDPQHGITPEQVHESGARWHRIVLHLDRDVRPYCAAAHALGDKVLGVLDSDSLTRDPDHWDSRSYELVRRYGSVMDAVQFFNEPDSPGGTHGWPLPIYDLCKGIEAVVPAWSGITKYGPGLSNSKPWYLDEIDWKSLGLDGIACQGLYGRWPTEEFRDEPACRFGSAPELLDRFCTRAEDQGLLVIVSEWGYKDWEVPGHVFSWSEWEQDRGRASAASTGDKHADIIGAMARLLRQDKRLAMAFHFCISDRMVPGFGLQKSNDEAKPAYFTFWQAQKEEPLPDPDLDTEARLDQQINVKIASLRYPGAEYKPRDWIDGKWRVAYTDAGIVIAIAHVPGAYLLRDS
jgi:hypothetical protein